MSERTLAVVGAINVDLIVTGTRLPSPGETVMGGTFARHQGGKGGNQAVAAARALDSGTNELVVVMIGAVGADDMGRDAIASLTHEGISTLVHVEHAAATGVALIVVDQDGENQIAVASGANGHLKAAVVSAALERCKPAVVLASLEVAPEAVQAAAEWCDAASVPLVLNPAPAAPWARDLLPLAAYVTPNEAEREVLGDVPVRTVVVETRGASGVVVREGDVATEIPAPAVEAVDTTGAGDCFNGVFAAGLLEGMETLDAVHRAVHAAGLAVQRAGAREGMPFRRAL